MGHQCSYRPQSHLDLGGSRAGAANPYAMAWTSTKFSQLGASLEK
jgi:hypothetical protein